MDLRPVLPAFFLAVLLISASPGPAMALILRRAALRGFRRTVPVVLGLEVGLYAWALLAAAGVAALVAASEVGGGWRAFGEGVAVQLANPKAAVFMVAFFPPAGDPRAAGGGQRHGAGRPRPTGGGGRPLKG
jgi:threonine/homoserine/homoserine lactone efflux protein